MTAFVLGNGLSRRFVDPNDLIKIAPVYACNAIYKEFTPTVLVSTDTPISREIQESGYSLEHRMYTRRPIDRLGAHRVPQQYFGFSSGPIAVALAALDYCDPIVMIGFDMGPDPMGRFNNVYAGTTHYKKTGSAPTYTGNWVKQLDRIMRDFDKRTFIRVIGDTTAPVPELANRPNFETATIAELLAQINIQKDL